MCVPSTGHTLQSINNHRRSKRALLRKLRFYWKKNINNSPRRMRRKNRWYICGYVWFRTAEQFLQIRRRLINGRPQTNVFFLFVASKNNIRQAIYRWVNDFRFGLFFLHICMYFFFNVKVNKTVMLFVIELNFSGLA